MKKITSLLLFSVAILAGCQDAPANNLYPEESIAHAHGLAVDSADPNKLYVATHYGLYVLVNETDLYRIGALKDDYMGFSVHPTNAQTFYSSGHPSTSGNLGIQKSEDGGVTWEKIGNGVNGPVDFHAMAVSAAHPDILYGYDAGALQRSVNGGKDWEVLAKEFPVVVHFTPDPSDENTIFAGTLQQSVLVSNDKGLNFKPAFEELKDTVVIALAIDPQNSQTMLSFSLKLGLAKSNDAGKTWEKINENFDGDMLLYIAFDKNTAGKAYALTKNNAIYKSSDGWNRWSKIR